MSDKIDEIKALIIEQTIKLAIIKMIDPDSSFAAGYAQALVDVAEVIDPKAVSQMRELAKSDASFEEIIKNFNL